MSKKTIQILTTILALGYCLTWGQEVSIEILSTIPSFDLRDHKQYDVTVYKTISSFPDHVGEQLYAVAFYRNENDSLRIYKAFYGSEDTFDIAFYKWENDSTVAIRLHNIKEKKDLLFKVIGYGNTTGIED